MIFNPSAIRYTFTVHERLKREQHIKTLFQQGKAFSSFPLKCIWLQLPRDNEMSPVRVAVSVPKKRTPLAVHRNRTKRLIREAWRLNKHSLYEFVPPHVQLHLFFIFTGTPHPDFAIIQQSVSMAIETLCKQMVIINQQNNDAKSI